MYPLFLIWLLNRAAAYKIHHLGNILTFRQYCATSIFGHNSAEKQAFISCFMLQGEMEQFCIMTKYRMEMNCLLELIHNTLQNRLRTASFPLPQLFRAHCDLLSVAFSLFQHRHLNKPPLKICWEILFLHK